MGGKPLHVCVPVLRRYDLLREMLLSLNASTVQPKSVHVIDNGNNPSALANALGILPTSILTDIFVPKIPLGLATAWNWFITHIPEERLITNDDVAFAPTSLEVMLATDGDMISCISGNDFSCFLLRNSCVDKVGFFDDTISPGYAFWEDVDYEERMRRVGTMFTHIDCDVKHVGSATLAAATSMERQEHNRRFILAQDNFIKKWGHLPEGIQRQFV